ncbi:VCBS repeat-containing protein [Lutimaribacter sp. EGI FJ00015]|uniref:VCBS repeat-containing protein n=1 Tax=Lutimaribacter degradans TaxID=2945989 RepID=A0ACC5ZRZ0_9RHOB|nr:VCBS repeat-containing protein [Lutimaribacter sp. EGI FJ00013]MCM2560806.1 VCBS repeat-containing protein [Lutimaribacter sp. EGI FJ00013]MCO0612248.1 VCBS repeat-containing protein [Lutimaribacter sp. EGI FJ00015]MCO0634631.1 VCBS repeat-containing protein [Lutimaribacter sp. EGI FJ00014]
MARAAGIIACCAALFAGTSARADLAIEQAGFDAPTTHYAHAVLGDGVEYGALVLRLTDGQRVTLRFAPGTRVFEDIAPRLWDVTGDGAPEAIVVETDPARGAQLSVYGLRPDGGAAKLAATPHIGQPNRWLAPVAAADLDGDGRIEIAYVDRPHLAKRLRIWRFDGGTLRHVIDHDGLTNHKIGWDFIPGGLRDCDDGPELITADAGWQNVMATRFDGRSVSTRALAPYAGPESLAAALRCD